MRWLFAMLIALFCWTASVSGPKLYAAQTVTLASALSAQSPIAEHVVSLYDQDYRPHGELRRKPFGKLLPSLPRMHSYLSSLQAPTPSVPAYTLATDLGYHLRPQWQADNPAPNRLRQVNWMLNFPQQQSRLGGWKESNMLYRGSLTYHS